MGAALHFSSSMVWSQRRNTKFNPMGAEKKEETLIPWSQRRKRRRIVIRYLGATPLPEKFTYPTKDFRLLSRIRY